MLNPLEYDKQLLSYTMEKYNCSDPWDVVDVFEKTIAEYGGSKYAVAVDNCTDAMFLCLKYLNAAGTVEVPRRTYVSVPCTIKHAGCSVKFVDDEWSGAYQLKPFPVYDAATRMKRGMYVPDSYYCLSFHRRKHIPIGKGGMILTDNEDAYNWFKVSRYEGRHMDRLYKDDHFDTVGWNMYLPPEQAARGLYLFHDMIEDDNPDLESSGIHKDLSKYRIYE